MEYKLMDAIGSIGVQLYDNRGNARSVMDVMNDIADVWSNLTKEDKELTLLNILSKSQ